MEAMRKLLLGTTVSVITIAGALASDLPLKARTSESLKVCGLYGAGYHYIPGTDTCLKVGGYVRADVYWNNPGSFAQTGGVNAQYTRITNELTQRARGMVSLDARTATEYGTLRSYMLVGAQTTPPTGGAPNADAAFLNFAFVQLAGFTIGKTVSYYDIFGFAPFVANHSAHIYSDTSAIGTFVLAYTAQFGEGFSATVSLEDWALRRRAVVDLSNATNYMNLATLGGPTTDQAGGRFFDVVGLLRVDQAWGWAGISGAIHDISAQYYGANVTTNSHPADAWGWVIATGAKINVPWVAGDTFGFQINYSQGALGYITNIGGPAGAVFNLWNGNTVGLGVVTDGVFNGGSIERTTGWGFNAGYEHVWTPQWRTSLYGGYVNISHNDTAKALITAAVCPGSIVAAAANCDPDFAVWQVGGRLLWKPVTNLDVGLDVMYTAVQSAFKAPGNVTAIASPNRPAGSDLGDTNIWTGMFRVQRNFWP